MKHHNRATFKNLMAILSLLFVPMAYAVIEQESRQITMRPYTPRPLSPDELQQELAALKLSPKTTRKAIHHVLEEGGAGLSIKTARRLYDIACALPEEDSQVHGG